MIAAGHVFDESATWTQRATLTPLCTGSAVQRCAAQLFALAPAARAVLKPLALPITSCPRLAGAHVLAAPVLRHALQRRPVDVVHAWGVSAAAAAHHASAGRWPIAVTLLDAGLSAADRKLLRTLLTGTTRLAIACGSGTVLRRLVESGIPAERCVIIRPPVDLGVLNAARRSDRRQALGLGPDVDVCLLAGPWDAGHDHFAGLLAGALRHTAGARTAVVLAGAGRELDALPRFTAGLSDPRVCVRAPAAWRMEQVIAACDTLLLPARHDLDPTLLAWAMGAGLSIVAAAFPSVAELITHSVNGYLYKPGPPRTQGVALAHRLADRPDRRRLADSARSQAYEVFSVRRYVDQTLQLYDNLRAGRPAANEITDTARTA